MTFAIGQRFDGVYPPEAAAWCNTHNAHIAKHGSVYVIVANPLPTPEEIKAYLSQVIQDRLDSEAQALDYDDCHSVCTYFDSDNAKFDAEGRAFRRWRSACWDTGNRIVDQVKQGIRPIPTEEELLAELPELRIVYE